MADYRKVPLENQMLNGLFAPTDVEGGVFYSQESRLDSADELFDVGRDLRFDLGGDFLSDRTYEGV